MGAHSGRIWASNAPEGGAIIHIELPAWQTAQMPPEPPTETVPMPAQQVC
jgi:K+-sensing histidine kinase KdpD